MQIPVQQRKGNWVPARRETGLWHELKSREVDWIFFDQMWPLNNYTITSPTKFNDKIRSLRKKKVWDAQHNQQPVWYLQTECKRGKITWLLRESKSGLEPSVAKIYQNKRNYSRYELECAQKEQWNKSELMHCVKGWLHLDPGPHWSTRSMTRWPS